MNNVKRSLADLTAIVLQSTFLNWAVASLKTCTSSCTVVALLVDNTDSKPWIVAIPVVTPLDKEVLNTVNASLIISESGYLQILIHQHTYHSRLIRVTAAVILLLFFIFFRLIMPIFWFQFPHISVWRLNAIITNLFQNLFQISHWLSCFLS